LDRLFFFLEAQFGAENLELIRVPKLDSSRAIVGSSSMFKNEGDEEVVSGGSEDEERERAALQQRELERLLKIGIPVPGVEIKVDKNTAKVWLEDLEIECSHRMLAERVRVVLERAVEVTAPLWS
jgi:cleavage and polyadenylation specificity factor subunit 3